MNIVVKVRNNYGQQAVYPVCAQAVIFAELANSKTLTPKTINLIKQLGYEIVVQQETVIL